MMTELIAYNRQGRISKRYVTLADGRHIGLGTYIRAWKACRELAPETAIGRGISGWGENAGEALSQLREGIHARINRHLSWYGKGRKWHHDWQRHMLQASYQINDPRLIIRWLPADLMKIERFRERVEYGRAA